MSTLRALDCPLLPPAVPGLSSSQRARWAGRVLSIIVVHVGLDDITAIRDTLAVMAQGRLPDGEVADRLDAWIAVVADAYRDIDNRAHSLDATDGDTQRLLDILPTFEVASGFDALVNPDVWDAPEVAAVIECVNVLDDDAQQTLFNRALTDTLADETPTQ